MALSTIYSPTVTRAAYLALEDPAAQGVPTALTHRVEGFGVDMDRQAPQTEVRPVGHKYPVAVMVDKEHTRLALSGQPAINDLVYLLCSVLQTATYSGGAWVFTPNTFQPDVFDTYTIGIGDNRQMSLAAGCYCESLSLTFPPNAAPTFQAQMMGKTIDYTTSLPDSGITAIPIVPLQPKATDVYKSDTVAGLDTATRLPDLTATWGISNTRGMFYMNNSTENSFSGVVDTVPAQPSSFIVPMDAVLLPALIAEARAAHPFFYRVRNAFTYNGNGYALQIDQSVNYAQDAGAAGENQGLAAATFNLVPRHDDTLGGSVKITVTTDMAVR